MWNTILCGGLLIIAGGCATKCGSCSSGRFDHADVSKPGFFPILPWDPYHGWGQPLVENRTNGFKGLAECNFNMAGFVLPRDLPECQRFGLGAIMLPVETTFTNVQYIYGWKGLSDEAIDRRVKTMVDAAGSNPAIVGYFVTDEPGVADFPALGKAVAAVKKYAPGKLAYINLFPSYATLGAPDTSQLGTPSYSEYLERFVSEVKPQLISYDNYMVQYSMDMKDAGTAANYYLNLLDVRRVALEHELPYLNIVASCQLRPDKAVPSPANMRLQAFTTLAAGYRGVTWYTYFGDFYPYAPLSKSGEKTATWTALQAVNQQVALLAPLMSRMKSTGVYFTSPVPASGLPTLPGKLVEGVSSKVPVMVGEFRDNSGGRYVMVVNLSLEQSADVQIQAANGFDVCKVLFSPGGFTSCLKTDTVYLAPGEGALMAMVR